MIAGTENYILSKKDYIFFFFNFLRSDPMQLPLPSVAFSILHSFFILLLYVLWIELVTPALEKNLK
jgi:hypothetical protein